MQTLNSLNFLGTMRGGIEGHQDASIVWSSPPEPLNGMPRKRLSAAGFSEGESNPIFDLAWLKSVIEAAAASVPPQRRVGVLQFLPWLKSKVSLKRVI